MFKKDYIPFWVTAIVAAFICCMTEWMGDAVDYAFIIRGAGADPAVEGHIKDLGDILQSQCNHYMYENGRFFVHFIVQLFCGILGKYAFAVCNAVVWWFLPYLCLKASGLEITLRNAVISSTVLILLMFYLRFDPPLQVNYVWMSLMTAGFVILFFSKRKTGTFSLILLAVYSFLYGEGNEAFTFAVGTALIAYAVAMKFRLSVRQWVMAVSCAIGAVILAASPGNWIRLGLVGEQYDGLVRVEMMLPALIIPIMTLLTFFLTRKHDKDSGSDSAVDIFLWTGVIAGYVLCVALKGSSGARMAIPANLFLTFILLRRLRGVRVKGGICAVAGLLSLAVYGYAVKEDLTRSMIERKMYSSYASSTDGTVYLPDRDFSEIARQFVKNRRTYTLKAAYHYPGKPALRLRPQSMKRLSETADTNLVINLSEDAWVLYRSKTRPADVIVRKWAFPAIMDKEMPVRVLDFSPAGDVLVDSTDNCEVGVYVNERRYIKALPEIRPSDCPQQDGH